MTRLTLRRWLAAWAAIMAGAVGLLAFPLAQLWQQMAIQIGFLRAVGTLDVLLGLLAALAGAIAALAVALRLDGHARLKSIVRMAVLAGVFANVAMIGLMLYFHSPMQAPWPPRFGALALVGAVVLAHMRQDETGRRLQGRAVLALSTLAYLVPLVFLPQALQARLNDQPPQTGAPPLTAHWPARPDAPKRIVLVTFDALRARSTSMIAPTLDATPQLAALAREATWFSSFRSLYDSTIQVLPTILAGVSLEEIQHGFYDGWFHRHGAFQGLGQLLAPAGYRSHYATMLLSPQNLGMHKEFADGYATAYMFPIGNDFNTEAYFPVGQALAWLKARTSRRAAEPIEAQPVRATFDAGLRQISAAPERSFVWLHLGVPHAPVPTVRKLPTGEYALADGPSYTEHDVLHASPTQLERYEAMYVDYLRYGDAEFGRFIRELKRRGLYDDTLLVVTADHGEQFKHGQPPHGTERDLDDVRHVPLLIRKPRQAHPAVVSARRTQLDIVPTILQEVYGRVPDRYAGRPLLSR